MIHDSGVTTIYLFNALVGGLVSADLKKKEKKFGLWRTALYCIAVIFQGESEYGDELMNCHSPTQPQLELVLDLIMGRNQPPHHPTQELLRHFQAT